MNISLPMRHALLSLIGYFAGQATEDIMWVYVNYQIAKWQYVHSGQCWEHPVTYNKLWTRQRLWWDASYQRRLYPSKIWGLTRQVYSRGRKIDSVLWSDANFAQMKSETKYLFFCFLVTEIEFCNLAAICICNFCRIYNKTI